MSSVPNPVEASEGKMSLSPATEPTRDTAAQTLDVERTLLSDPNDPDAAQLARAIHFAPWYVAIAASNAFWWSFLVAGEFVLSGLPESLGALTLLALSGANYWALERRFSAYMPTNAPRQRLMTVTVVALLSLLVLGLAMVLGLFIPELLLTPLLFVLVAGVAIWQRRTRMKLYPAVGADRSYAMVLRVVLASVATLFAIAALFARQ